MQIVVTDTAACYSSTLETNWPVRAAGHVGVWVLQLCLAIQNHQKLAGKYAEVDSTYDGVCRGGRHGHQVS